MPRVTMMNHFVCLLALAVVSGCPASVETKKATTEDIKKEEAHAHEAHEHTAPNGGHLIELGNHEYNAEVVFDKDAKVVTIYMWDAHAENAVAVGNADIKFVMEHDGHEDDITLKAMPKEGDPEGKASKFVSEPQHEHLKEITDVEALHGTVKVKINDKDYSGKISHDHGHEHGHEHKDGEAKTEEKPAS